MKIKIAKKEIIHFIGIGGIGMSGLSLIMNSQGFKVQGSDINTNKNIERLKKEKIQIFLGQSKNNLNKATIVVVSSAIKNDNPELIEAKKRNIPVIKRGEMLANLVSLMKNIVVVGSHGKTTTTSLLAAIFQETKIDPTIINGGVINAIKNTAKLGTSDWSILEADESDGSFIHISPTYAIITNIDREHMDFYKSMNDLKNKNFYTYGQKNGSNLRIINIRQNKLYSQFDININFLNEKNQIIKNIKIPLLGIHNIRNAVGSIGVALSLGIPVKNIKRGLKNFKGVERRFNKVFTYNNVDVYDDYAHHPTEIKVVLEGIKKVFTTHEKICIFQPHRISRLKDLKKEFSLAFKDADTVILCPIYTAGEKIKLGFSYESFAKLLIKNSRVKLVMIENKFELAKYLKNSMYGKKLIVGMGAGSISSWIRDLPKLIK